MLRNLGFFALSISTLAFVSCGDDTKPVETPQSVIAESFWSDAPLENAVPVGDIRETVEDGADVVLKGRLKDFVEGRAVFTLIDFKLKSCAEIEGDNCPTPWDYCCVEPDVIAKNTVTIEIHGEGKSPLKAEAKGFHGLDHLDKITVSGKAKRDSGGNVRIIANRFHASR